MSEFDIYLNGQGYMLAKSANGDLVPGAARDQTVDPFTQFLSRDEPYTRLPFRFGDGCGLTEHDGSHRYQTGHNIDTRAGAAIISTKRTPVSYPGFDDELRADADLVAEQIDSGGSQRALAERFQVPTGRTTIRNVAVLVKRDPDVDYSSASSWYVDIYPDVAGPKPGATMGTATMSLIGESDPWLPFPDRWRNGDWFWIEATFSSGITVTAGSYYWIGISNAQTPQMYWAEDQDQVASATRSVYNGTSWSNGASDYPLQFKLGFQDDDYAEADSFVRCFQVFRGNDNVERMYAGTGYRVIYYDEADGEWKESKDTASPVLHLLEFDEKLFAALGDSTDMQYTNGASATTTWTAVTSEQANALAIHDNMLWKADVATVEGCEDGTTWGHGTVDVGDPGNPVMSMVSHGGKLYCAKPEGIYEVSYPDTYPTSGDPTCNLLLDFSTERCSRPWIMDWHSALYFPGLGGVYELKGGVLRNLWTDKIDDGAIEVADAADDAFTTPRRWSPTHDKGPAGWMYAHGSTRGILFCRSDPHTGQSDLIWYDGRNWHSLWATADGISELYGEYITAACVQDLGGGRGRIWWTRGMDTMRAVWPTWTNNLTQDEDITYEPSGYVITPWFSLPQQSKSMLLCKVGLVSKEMTGLLFSPDVEISYKLDDDASWTTLATLDTSPYEEADFPSGTTARRVQLRLELDAGSSDETPIVEQIDLLYQVLPEQSKTHQLIISCQADLALREAGVDERTAGEIVTDLKALVGNTGFTYTDLLGADHTVRMTAITIQPTTTITGPGPEAVGVEMQAIVNLLEV